MRVLRRFVLALLPFSAPALAMPLYYPATSYKGTPASLHWEREPEVFRIGEQGEILRFWGGGWYPHATDSAQYALSAWDRYTLTGEPTYLDKAQRSADYWINHATHMGDYDVLEFTFDLSYHGYFVPAPWRNAMAQGQMLSLYARLYSTTGDARYLTAGERLLKAFGVTLEQGGLRQILPQGRTWFPEVAKPGYRFQILNGFMFSLVGLYDWWWLTRSDDARLRFNQGFDSLVFYLPQYDTGSGSNYDILGHAASLEVYHVVHVGLLRYLHEATQHPVVWEFYSRWAGYIGDVAYKRGDANRDGFVSWADLDAIRESLPRREYDGPEDVTHDRVVDCADVLAALDAIKNEDFQISLGRHSFASVPKHRSRRGSP